MSKSIAIIDTPTSCYRCKFNQTMYWLPLSTNRHGFICQLNREEGIMDISCDDEIFKSRKCPLKEIENEK